ncbi:hypothetical protein ACH4OW_14755 [Streptomyces sp. NPDC017056]|uniref:hypothetical protein n=1 Tax=Streptomyces sp. NPDC017056 TaxID=3364973 RepID=UPI0037B83351
MGTPAEPWHSHWWETPALGDQIDDLMKAADSPDHVCTTWRSADGRPIRRIPLGYPRLGTRRRGLVFASGLNITDRPLVTYGANEYAQVVIVTGSREDHAQQRAIDAVRHHPAAPFALRAGAKSEDRVAFPIADLTAPAVQIGRWNLPGTSALRWPSPQLHERGGSSSLAASTGLGRERTTSLSTA